MASDILVTFDANLGGNALAKLEEIKAQLDALVKGTHEIKVNVNGKDVIKQLNNIASGKTGGKIVGGKGAKSGLTGAIKLQTAELQTQKQLLSEMMSTVTGARKTIRSSPLLNVTQKEKELGRLKLLMDDINRYQNATRTLGYNSPEMMRNITRQVDNVRERVKALKNEEKALKRIAATEKKRAEESAKAASKERAASERAATTAEKNYNKIWGSAEQSRQKDISSRVQKAINDISNYEKRYQKLAASPFGNDKSVSSFGQQIARVRQMAEAAGKIKIYDPQGTTKLNQLASAVTGLGTSYAKVKAQADAFAKSQKAALSESKAFTRQAGTMQKKIETFMAKNPRLAGTTYEQQLQNLIGGMQSRSKSGTGTLANLKSVEQQFKNIQKAAADAGKTGQTFGQSIVGAVKQFGGWMLVTHTIMRTIQGIKNMIGTVTDLDTAMTELRRVTNETSDTYDQFYQGAAKRSVDIGATLKDTIQASADFVKLGYDINEAPGLADAALVYKNVGIGIEDISDASASIISTMKAFGIEADDAMGVVDRFNEVGNHYAITSKGIGDALVRSASALAEGGNTLDESIGLITGANTILQDPEKVGTTLKTVSMYLRSSKAELEDAGESTDGLVESTSKLRDELLALTGHKVDILADENTFKSTTEIFRELSKVWDELPDITQAAILEKLGGKRNANATAALISQFDIVEQAIETSKNAAGSATKENEKYMESIEGRVKKFKAVWEGLSADFFSTDFIKGVVSGTTAVASGLDGLIQKIHAIPTLMGIVTASMSAFRLRQNGRTGIFDVVTNPKGPPSVRLFNNELKSLGGTIKDVYGTYYRQAGGGVKGFANAGVRGTFGLLGASVLGRGGEIKEYNQLASAYKKALEADKQFRGKDNLQKRLTPAGQASAQNVKQTTGALIAYNQQLQLSNSLWAQYARSINQTGAQTKATFSGFTKWLVQNNKMGEAFVGTFTKGLASVGSMLGSAFLSVGISAAVMGVISLIGKLANAQNELRQKAHDTAVEYQQTQKSVSDYAAEVNSIETNLSSGTLSIDETIAARQRLATIQSELVSQYGSEAAGLNLVGASAEQAAAAMEHLAQVQADRFLNDPENQKGFNQAVEDMEKVRSFTVQDFKDIDSARVNQLKELTNEFDAINMGTLNKSGTRFRLMIKADTRDGIKQIDQFISEAEARGIDLTNIFASNGNSIYSDLMRIRKQYAEIEAASGESYDAQADAAIKATDKYIEIQDKINEAKSNYDEALLGVYDSDEDRARAVQGAIQGLRDVQDVVNNTDFTGAKGVGDSFRDQINSALDGVGEEEFKADIELNVNSDSLDDAINNYKSEMKEVSALDADLNKTTYGNIDLQNRQRLEWTQQNVDKYRKALESWGQAADDYLGSYSTVDGMSSEFDGVEIAFSPMLQTDHGAEFLDKGTVEKYINGIIDSARGQDGKWKSEDVFKLDAKGMEVDGKKVKGLIADIGDTAIKTGESMHYIGKDGSIQDGIDNIKSSFDNLSKDAPDKMKNLLSAVKQFQSDSGEIKVSDILDGQKTNAAGWEQLSAAAKDYGVSVEFALQKLADAHVIQSDSTDLAYNANEQFKDLFATTNGLVESQQLLNSVYSEQSQKGTLSLKTYEALTKEHKEFAGMLEAEGSSIKFNADAAQQLIDTQAKETEIALQQKKIDALTRYKQNKDAIDELEQSTRRLTETEQKARDAKIARLKSENEDIEANVAKTNIQIAQLESITSAYSKWQVATQTANQDTMYNDMINAKKEIEEGLKLERFGRDEYQTAVRMLIPDAPSPYDKKAINSYMDKLNRYITSDENGAITKTGMNNFLSDAVDAGLMTVEDGVHKVIDGIKPEDFVEKLKITPSMAKAIFGLLEDYGGEFTWTAEDFFHLENVEEAKNKINEVKEAYDKIDQNTDYENEGRAKVIHDLAESQKEDILGVVDSYQRAIDEMNLYRPDTQSFADAHDRAEDLMNVIKELPPEILLELGIDTDKLDDLLNPERAAEPIKIGADTTEAESKVEHVGETYNTTKDGIESNPINTPSPDMSGTEEGVEEPERRYMAMKERMESESIHPPGVDTSGTEVNLEVPERRYMAAKEKIESDSIHLPAPDTEAVNAGIEGAERRYLAAKERIEAASIHPPSTDKGAADATDKDIKVNIDANTDAAKAKIEALSGTPVKVPIEADPTGIQNAVQSGANGPIRVDVDANVVMAKQQIASLNNMVINVDVQARVANAQNQINGMTGPQIDSTNVSVNYTPNLNALPNSFPDITRMVNYIAQLAALPSTLPPITRMVNYVSSGVPQVNGTANASGTAHASGTANASGNWGTAPGGTTLVGELGEELVVDVNSGRWYTVGTNGAEFTNIAPGSIVFNHKQTEALFKYGKVAGRGRALASGTAMAGGSTDSFDNGRIPLSATAALDIELNVNDKDLEKKLEKELSEMSDKLEYILGQYEHKIFLIEKNAINGFTEEDTRNVIAIYKKMMDEVHAQADAARAKGLSDNSATVRQLSEKWYELRDNMKEAIDEYYDGLISKTQNAIKLLDFQTGELQNKFHNRTEMVYKQVDAISTATKEVSDELQKLGQGGNVDLLKRPVIDASILRDVGWDDAGNGKATVFSSTFSNEDGTKAINFTPIIVDENGHFVDALEPDTLERYAEEVIAGVHDDNLGLQIGAVFNGEDAIQQAELAAERVHELHEKYFLSPDKRTVSYWEFSDDGNYDAVLKNLDEIIEKQREIQRIAHEGADEKRALGYEEDSDEIRKFKDDWEGAAEAIVEAITTAYDAITGDLENRITLTENWLDNAVKGIGNDGDANFDQVRKYSDDIYNYYTQMQTAIHEEAERLRALGYSDTSEEVSKLSDLWWDYEEKRKTAAINAWKEIVQTAKDATDEVAGMYDTLKQAAKEYSSMGGYLTLDTLEKLLEMEPKYMQMLKEENGLWVIDEENVKKATAAKMEDLAITNALAYVERLRLAITGQSNEKLEELLWVTHETADATWQLVYAQLASLDLTDDQYDAALHNINVIRSMAHAAIEGIGKESDEYKKQLDEMKDGLDDLIKYVMDMLKHKIDEQVDSLEDMKDKYKDIVDKKKESLQLTKKENDYQKGVRNKLKDMVKLQAQIESLRLDTSREAMAKRAQLEQQLVDIQEDVAETQADHAQELTEKALDDNLKAYEDEKDQEIESLKKSISSEEKLYRMAVNYIRDNWSTLYDELIAWNTEYGSVINDEIDEAWRNASAAVERYGGYLEAVKAVTQELKDITDSVSLTVGKVDDADYDAEARAVRAETQKPASNNDNTAVVEPGSGLNKSPRAEETAGATIIAKAFQMKQNSAKYMELGGGAVANASSEQKNLSQENKKIANEISNLINGTLTIGDDGVWRLPDGTNLYDILPSVPTVNDAIRIGRKYGKYHSGGIAGGKSTAKQDEVFALLQKGEAIFTKDQQSSLMRILDFSKAIAGKFDNIAMTGASILTGQLKDLANSTMTPAYAGAANVSYDINVPVQIFPAQKMDENEIKSLTNKISDYTIKTINNDIGRRGIRGGTKRF